MLICCFCCWVTVAKLVICASDDSMFVVVVLHCTLKSTGPFFLFFFFLVLCMTWLFCHLLIRRRMPHCEMEQFCFMEAQWSCYAASICLWSSSFACKWALVRAVKKRPTGYGAPLRSMSWSILSAFQPLTVMPERVALGWLVSWK